MHSSPEKLMVIEVPMPPLTTQQTFERFQIEAAALKAIYADICAANAVLLPATQGLVFSEST